MYDQPQAGGNRVGELLGTLLESAKAHGAIRSDATVADIRILAGGCARQLARTGIADPEEWRRYGELVMSALRPA
ncbi:hypothetical protein ACIBO9_28330 [Streptomyces prunicolor]|uniref:SbtR family transcriptional regulator n=1 Tax=Streptomyces prunicolor TaxID=67348 RepID=UPI0037CEF88D